MTVNQVSDVVKKFFEDFERGSNTFESDLLALQFSDPFMAVDPDGGIQVVKKDDFLAGISQRQAFFQSMGFQFVKVSSLDETRLDDHYVMVKAHVQMRFEKNQGQPIDLIDYSTYILFVKDDSPKIVFYTTHENLMKIMQERGLLPAHVEP
ncbi:MAG TPA: hypothetical protein VKB35_17545 [Ktedonobacteraceae bacterium]|nr:hypothetical protein [Ktedonobacteraceae bacterium]